MPWWAWVIGIWFALALGVAWGWSRFIRGIREWEDARDSEIARTKGNGRS